MRRAILGMIVLLVSGSAAFACGTERWPVKIGTDGDARSVANLPKATSIAELMSIAAPAHPERRRTSRFAPPELTTFQITGTLKVIKREADDDYHLDIADPVDPRVTMGFRAVSIFPELKNGQATAEVTLLQGTTLKKATEKLD